MSRSTTTRSNWLGAPLIGLDRRNFEESILKRFPPPTTEQAVGYIERATDRQISKARGLLIFNAVLFVILSFVASRTPLASWATLGSIALFVSSLSLLFLFHTSWGQAEQYATAESDFRRACQTFYRGAYLLNIAITATTVALVIAGVTLFAKLHA